MRERYLLRCCEQSFAIHAHVMSADSIAVVGVQKLFAYRVVSTVLIDFVSRHVKYCRTAYGSKDSRMHCKEKMNEWHLILWRFNFISSKEWNETSPSHPCLKSANRDLIVGFWDMKLFI